MEEIKSDIKNKIMVVHPPGRLFQRGEDRCQVNLEASVAQSLRACNDLGYAASALLKENYEVKLRDYQGESASENDFFNDLEIFNPDMLVMSITDTTIFQDLELIERIKKHYNPIIVLKGVIFWDYNQDFINELNLDKVDYLIGAELEFSISKLADFALKSSGDIKEIANLFYKNKEGKFIPTKFGQWEHDLDKIIFPARDLMNNDLYTRPDTGEAMATIQTSRGCPCSCIFCLVGSVSGKKVRFRSPENVFDEIVECYKKYNIKNFFFRSDCFTIDENWTRELCKLIINSDLWKKIEFTANSRVNPLKKETLEIMKKAGCFLVAFGCESGSEDTMKRIKKGATVQDNLQAIKWTKELGLESFGMFVIGFPWETKKHFRETKKFINEANPDFVEINLAIPFRGTNLYDLCIENFKNNNLFGTDFYNPKISINPNFTINELINIRRNILLTYYLKPSYILNKIFKTISNRKYKVLKNYIFYGVSMIKRLVFKSFLKKSKN